MSAEVGFVVANVSLRPPRVAILLREGEHWRDWVMHALAIASEYWGAGGFILVPYDANTGEPDARFAAIVRAYDPDHVVVLHLRAHLHARLHPDEIRFSDVPDRAAAMSLLENSSLEHADPSAFSARAVVAGWCSPLRGVRFRDDKPATETVRGLSKRETGRGWSGSLPARRNSGDDPILAADSAWRSDVGIFAAMRLGVDSATLAGRPEPDESVLPWLVRSEGKEFPGELFTASLTGVGDPAPLFYAGQGLQKIFRGYPASAGAVVIGDTGADFALALAYDRLLAFGIWLTPAWLEDRAVFRKFVQPAIQMRRSELENSVESLSLVSASIGSDRLDKFEAQVRQSAFQFWTSQDGEQIDVRGRQDTISREWPALTDGLGELVMDEHIGATIPLAMASTPDGTMEAFVGFESPVPRRLLDSPLAEQTPYWYVDVMMSGDKTPRGRDVRNDSLMIKEGRFAAVNLRAGRHGVTFSPQSMGFVSAGALLASRIGRPRLRRLSMVAWVKAMADAAGFDVQVSSAGRKAELVRSRVGTRDDLLDLAEPRVLPMLRAFAPRASRRSAQTEQDPDIVVVGLDPYLSFSAIEALTPSLSASERFDLVDRLVLSRVLRRGLILDCLECGRPSFIDSERLGPTFDCPNCAAANPLVSERWKRSSPEPSWFYDLYATLRELLDANGDVVLLAARSLRELGSSYLDAAELEFVDRETGKPVAEVDLIACVDGEVVIVEAKSNGKFTAANLKRQSAKLLKVADILRADRLVLATSADEWSAAEVEHFRTEGESRSPFSLRVEVLRRLGRTL